MSTELQPAPINQLTVAERAVLVFASVKTEPELKELAQKTADITTITNQDGYQQVHAARMVLKNERLEIERTGEAGREEAVKVSKAIIATQKRLIGLVEPEELRLKKIQDAWDAKIAAEKQRLIDEEVARVKAIQAKISEIRRWTLAAPAHTTESIWRLCQQADAYVIDATFAEFTAQATEALAESRTALTQQLTARRALDAEQERLRLERIELDKQKAAQAERDAEAKRLRDAEEAKQREILAAERRENERIAAERRAADEAAAKVISDANAAEAKRIAEERAKLEAAQEAAKPKPAKARMRVIEAESILQALVEHFGITRSEAVNLLSFYEWRRYAA